MNFDVKKNDLFILPLARIQTDNQVAGQFLKQIDVRTDVGAISLANGRDADAIGVRQRAGFADLDREELYCVEGDEASVKDMVQQRFE
ncbi:hypothetical protein EW146_g2176 [Bondarzewia mesenterica]|uniref:Uncharacterized protein n=1 Tax=Bondarzewia mesenterica TaxID=1095465 RepID=A0A4S4M3R3_9AGAM|nr:hypothetical protein EW146_g2176 [Bondarzewia mesenterica]